MADVSVRPARDGDAAALAAMQVATWTSTYARVLPKATLDRLDAQRPDFAKVWAQATLHPPTHRHRVLVACQDGAVVAAASLGPADDGDQDPGSAGEMFSLLVDPAHQRQGHGSRLLAASVDFLRGVGLATAVCWLDGADEGALALFTAAGWASDGSTRTLDLDGDGTVVVGQVRVHTDLTEEVSP